ncbi:MAG: SMC family ATPase [Methanocalculus sp. MSAO_Arc1]|uniref:AAA family ATPase n=1 Tax=Methanocalculus TaxID=71151 RepID=UPI000FEF5072|nr:MULTISPECIES: SMC family ATPase [unclassified Methanocalculus]MCP1662544.1 DNA repair exonuclease SbcCD ATPase subunit [Methanocalculus sp. AMF5]RQD80084.1 MAG: SMC family ATPase [Methanocalculus sp. MSAO_Arc1]
MIPESMTLKNFKRYRHQTFTFKDGITAIVGSNGSGKSTIMEAIVFALYGISGSGIDAEYVVSAAAGPKERCEVRLSFQTGGEYYTIVRSFRKGQTTHHDAQLNFGDGRLIATGVSPVREAVQQILRMGPADFRTTIYAPQRDLLALLDKNPVERKRWFMRALGIERIRDTSWEMIRSEIRGLEDRITTLSGRLAEIDSDRLKVADQEEEQKEKQYTGALADATATLEAIQLAETENTARREVLQQTMQELSALSSEKAGRQDALLKLARQLDAAETELVSLREDRLHFEASQVQEARYEEIKAHALALRAAREAHMDATNRLREAGARHAELSRSRARLLEQLSRARDAEATVQRLAHIPGERENLLTRRRSLQAAQEDYYRLGKELASLESEIRVLKDQVQALMSERETLAALEAECSRINKEIESKNGVLALSERFFEVERLMKECRLYRDQIREIEADIHSLREHAAPLIQEVAIREKIAGELSDARSAAEQIRGGIATLRSKIAHSETSKQEAGRHLSELDAAGEESGCPTCGHPLQDRYLEARTRLLDQIAAFEADTESGRMRLASCELRIREMDAAIREKEDQIARCVEAERNLAGIEARIHERTNEKERLASIVCEKEDAIRRLDVPDISHEEMIRQVEEFQALTRKRDEIAGALRRVSGIEKEQKSLASRAEGLFQRMDEVSARREESAYSEDVLREIDSALQALEPLYEEYREALVAAREREAVEEAIRVETEEITRMEQHSAELKAEIDRIGFDEAAFQNAEEELALAAENHDRYLSLKGKVERIPFIEADILRLTEEKNSEEAMLAGIEEKIAGYGYIEEELDATRQEAESLHEQKKKSDARIREITGLLGSVRERRGQIAGSLRNAAAYEKEQAQLLSEKTLLETTGTVMKQFAEHLIGSVRARIEGEVGEILSLITDGRYEHVTVDSDFSIRVHEAGEDYPASRFSGGEQDDIAVALRIALSRHIAATHRIRDATVLIFDEIFGSQDEERRRNLIRALRKQEPYFPQILLISHIEGVQEECQTVIRVEEQPDLTSIAIEVDQ